MEIKDKKRHFDQRMYFKAGITKRTLGFSKPGFRVGNQNLT